MRSNRQLKLHLELQAKAKVVAEPVAEPLAEPCVVVIVFNAEAPTTPKLVRRPTSKSQV